MRKEHAFAIACAQGALRQPVERQAEARFGLGPAALQVLDDLVSSSELLPGEDVRLLPGPDRAEVFQVVGMRGFGAAEGSR